MRHVTYKTAAKVRRFSDIFIFCEFIKEFISCISHKYKFEDIIENLFIFYSEQLDEFYNDNINDDEEENENDERGDELDNEDF